MNKIYKWNVAPREILSGRHTLLKNLQDPFYSIKDQMIQRFSNWEGGHCEIIIIEDFIKLLSALSPIFTEFDKQIIFYITLR